MSDDGQIAAGRRDRQDVFDCADDALLRVRRPFPPAYTCFRLREEGVDHGFKLVARKETRRGAVILAEIFDRLVTVEAKPASQNFSAVARLAFGARKTAQMSRTHGSASSADMRARPRSSRGQSGTGRPGSIATSGCVIK
jgi:hypothetical protein